MIIKLDKITLMLRNVLTYWVVCQRGARFPWTEAAQLFDIEFSDAVIHIKLLPIRKIVAYLDAILHGIKCLYDIQAKGKCE